MVYLELVPSLDDAWTESVRDTLVKYPFLSGVNVPDILRVPVRSVVAAARLAGVGVAAIPHIRAMDRDLGTSVSLVGHLIDQGVTSVLVVAGDAPQNPSAVCFPVSSESLIAAIKKTYPAVTVYAALDPYRQSVKEELSYCRRKIDAGADGFFTQPFFDARWAEIFLEQLSDTTVFLGVAPVTTENSLRYWTTTNHVVFPPSFSLTLADNAVLGATLIGVAERYSQHVYLMPIKVPVPGYLTALQAVLNSSS